MRLFIALDLEPYESYFSNLQSHLDKNSANLKLTESYHLTLKFLGDVMPQYVENYKKLLSEIKFKPFDITFSKIAYFSPKHIHVIFASLKDNRKLMTLQAQIDNSLRKYFPKEERFHPHVTLARVKQVYDKETLLKNIKTIPIESKTIKINHFKLILSTLTSEGPIYETIAECNN